MKPQRALCAISMAAAFLGSCNQAEMTPAKRPASSSAARPCNGVALPDTPAGNALQRWLDDFNGDDLDKIAGAFLKLQPGSSLEDAQKARKTNGGFDLVQVGKCDPFEIEFLLAERAGPYAEKYAFLAYLKVADKPPFTIETLTLRGVPKDTKLSIFTLDPASRARVIDGVISALDAEYVFPDLAQKMADTLRRNAERGEYNSLTSGPAFAEILTTQLQEVSGDKHLGVNYSPDTSRDSPTVHATPTVVELEKLREELKSVNCGFTPVEHLAGNIGYLKFDQFARVDICGPVASAAMNALAGSDALIIDLRDNGGGAPAMETFLASYLFSKPTHLVDLWTRSTGKTEQYWTTEHVEGKRFGGDKPVYVLTSRRTFSCAEAFAYNLQQAKRATIVGETTAGGAHPTDRRIIDGHFSVWVPFARAINPISKTNWEGVGVVPNVKVAAADALETALKLAAAAVKGAHE